MKRHELRKEIKGNKNQFLHNQGDSLQIVRCLSKKGLVLKAGHVHTFSGEVLLDARERHTSEHSLKSTPTGPAHMKALHVKTHVN